MPGYSRALVNKTKNRSQTKKHISLTYNYIYVRLYLRLYSAVCLSAVQNKYYYYMIRSIVLVYNHGHTVT